MNSKIWFITLTTIVLTGCAMTQKGAISRAHNAYEDAKFEKCLARLEQAESYGSYSELQNARISFQRGLCLEGAGRKSEAMAVYKNLIIKYPQTDMAAQARARIEG
jgi:tetratricopeptide (TPR) repeat protein